MKRLLLTIAALAFMVSPAAGFDFGPNGTELLVATQITSIDTKEHCLNFFEDAQTSIASQICDIDLVNQMVWPANAQVREIKIVNLKIGDPLWSCEFTLEVGGSAAVAVTTAINQTLYSVVTHDFKYNLADGDLVGIMVGQGVECGDGTADPIYRVELWGNFVDAESF
jgi:hypothetical protein